MKHFLQTMAAKFGRDKGSEPKAEPVDNEQPRPAADGETRERIKGLYQRCPLSSYNGGCCLFAWWYHRTLHCFYGNGDTIIEKRDHLGEVKEQPNVMCPKRAMWLEAKKRKLEKLAYEKAMRELAEFERDTENGLSHKG